MKKRLLSLVLCVGLVLGLTGCGSSPAAAEDTLPQIIIGSDDYKPYNYVDEDGNAAGIDVELAKEAFGRMGYEPVFRNIVWEKKEEYLADRQIDCLWGSFTMTEREDEYTWAGPYLKSRQVVVVRQESGIKILRASALPCRCPPSRRRSCSTMRIPEYHRWMRFIVFLH